MSEKSPSVIKAEKENNIRRSYAVMKRFAPPNSWDGEKARVQAEKDVNSELDTYPHGVDRSLGDAAIVGVALGDTDSFPVITQEMVNES